WLPSPTLSDLNVPNPVATPSVTSSYVLVVSNGNGCPPDTDNVMVIVHPIPPIHAGTDTTIMAGSSVTLTAYGGGRSYQWSPLADLSCAFCSDPVASPMKTRTYTVTTVDAYGCRNQDTVTIQVED